MATRNLSAKFLTLRQSSRTRRGPAAGLGGSSGAAAASLADEEAGLAAAAAAPDERPADSDTPAWVTIHAKITSDLNLIREKIRALQRLHATRLRVSFGDNVIAEQQKDIDNLTNEITGILRQSESGLKNIAAVGNDGTLTVQEKTTRLNVMRCLATELQQASKQFRHCQKDFLHNLRQQEAIGDQFLSGADGKSRGVSLEDAVEHGLTPSQEQELSLMAVRASEREKEIIRIAQSVNQVAQLFAELNMLVIEQGTVLDRIDYNVEQTLTKIKKGVVDLEDAEKASKKALTLKCIVLLAIICFLLLIVFIWKKS